MGQFCTAAAGAYSAKEENLGYVRLYVAGTHLTSVFYVVAIAALRLQPVFCIAVILHFSGAKSRLQRVLVRMRLFFMDKLAAPRTLTKGLPQGSSWKRRFLFIADLGSYYVWLNRSMLEKKKKKKHFPHAVEGAWIFVPSSRLESSGPCNRP
jgi:hypothetical protein